MSKFTDVVDVDELMEAMEAEAKRRSLKDIEAPKHVAVATHNSAYESKPYAAGDLPHTQGHHTADPFAPREGKTLVWRDVNMTLVRCVLVCLVCHGHFGISVVSKLTHQTKSFSGREGRQSRTQTTRHCMGRSS